MMEEKNRKKKIKKPITRGVAKVPVVMQMETLECGAACLDMILAYYGKWIPLEYVRTDCGVSRDGSRASNIVRAARGYGLNAKGYSMEIEEMTTNAKFPCIIHWKFNHFVVLNGFKGNKAYINDPSQGCISVPMNEFENAFTGICIILEPSEDFTPEGAQKKIIQFVAERLSGAHRAVTFVIVTGIIASICGMIMQVFRRVFLDRLLTGVNSEWTVPFIGFLCLLAVVQITVSWTNAAYSTKINGKMAVMGNTTFMWKILHLPMEFFHQRMAGDIHQRKNANTGIAYDMVNTVAPMLLNSFMMLFYLIVMMRYNVMLSMLGIITVIINNVLSNYISRRGLNVKRVQMAEEGNLSSLTVSGIEGIESIKATGSESGYFERWAGYQSNLNSQIVAYLKEKAYWGLFPTIVPLLCNNIVLISGIYLVMNGDFTIGMVQAFLGFLASYLTPATSLVEDSGKIIEMRTEVERIDDVMTYPEDIGGLDIDVDDESISFKKLSGNVEIKNVTFGYSPYDKPLIEDFNLSLKPGSRVAFVGASGCGKSTLSKLISGLYQPWSGSITFDGKKKSEIDRSVFTGSLAVVDQDITLFEDTISNNIKMWDESIEEFEVILAARDAQIHEAIMQRDGGYQYRIMENGKDFSGGQRQRIEIARILAQDPTIVVLDEATAALDAKTEYNVIESIKNRGITCIFIAHRLSTVRDCDEIIVLDRGKVIERGTHEELYAMNGRYTSLVANE